MAKRELDIEALLAWAYQVECADKACANAWSLGGGVDSCARLEHAMVAGGGHEGSACHPDAEAVHFAVLGLSEVQQALVLAHAKNGTQPDWLSGGKLVMAAMVGSNGNPKRIYDRSRNVIGHMVAPAMELPGGVLFYAPADKAAGEWFGEVVAIHHRQYSAWHGALADLALHLIAGQWLADHSITGPQAKSEPWKKMA